MAEPPTDNAQRNEYERLVAEREAALSGLEEKESLNSRLLDLAAMKQSCVQKEHALELHRRQRHAEEVQRGTQRQASQLSVDLVKNRVDLHRWRQRTALLKVRLSSAQEDVERFRRMDALLRRQLELELQARRGCKVQVAALACQLAAYSVQLQEQRARIAALQEEMLKGQGLMAQRSEELAQQRQEMATSSAEARALLAASQAACTRLQEQVAAVQERAALADQTAAAAQERANLAEQTLRQKEALLAEKERFQSDMQHFSQDLQKLARETSGAVEGRLQQQLVDAQEQLFEEKRRRADAEGEAQVSRARAEQAQREVDRLQRSLAARDALVQQLKAARLTDTPAREVANTMELVGSLAADLAATPATDLRRRSAAAAAAVEAAAGEAARQPMDAKKKRGKQQAGKAVAVKKDAGRGEKKRKEQRQEPDGGKNRTQPGPANKKQKVQPDLPAAQAGMPQQASPSDSWSDGSNSSGADSDVHEPSLPAGKGKNGQTGVEAADVRPKRERKQAGAYWLGAGEDGATSPDGGGQAVDVEDGRKRGRKADLGAGEDYAAAAEASKDASKAAKRAKQPKAGAHKAGAKPRAGEADKENGHALNVLSAAADAMQQQQDSAAAAGAVPKSRLETRPLSAINNRVLAEAERRQDMSQLPITAQLQKVIAARSAWAPNQADGAPQQGKRKLLSVSSAFRLPGDAVPAHMMFGAGKRKGS